jgi:predicted nucleic acid-binding protein
VNLVDSSAWLEYFADGPNAGVFAPAIQDTRNLLVPSVCLLEVFKRVLQQRGESAALNAAAQMQQGRVIDLDALIALDAARLGFQMKLPLADSVILASAQTHRATIWTQDADFAHVRGVKYVAKK